MSTEAPSIPQVGMMATVRNRRAMVAAVEPIRSPQVNDRREAA